MTFCIGPGIIVTPCIFSLRYGIESRENLAYSRRNGWKNDLYVKSFNSSLFDNLPAIPTNKKIRGKNHLNNSGALRNLQGTTSKKYITSNIAPITKK
jgi:hypothetical protein